MGQQLHITRAQFWANNKKSPITENEWLVYIESDPDLELVPELGRLYVRWKDPAEICKYEQPWLNFKSGNIFTEWPDTALYKKMLAIAAALQAKVQDDDGAVYQNVGEWEFDPSSPEVKRLPPPKLSLWQKAAALLN